MKRIAFFVYGVACHALFLGVYAWMCLFVANLGFGWIPTIDGPPEGSAIVAVIVNTLLIVAFGVSHTVMARQRFKDWWTRYVPAPIERSTYVLVSCVLMILLLWQWRPINAVVWDVTNPAGRWALMALLAIGALAVPGVSLLINHFDLFGTRQVWLYLRGRPYTSLPFREPMVYRYVRHPLYIGWMLFFWATPTMTAGHLFFAALTTAYMIAAIPFEERDLIAYFGQHYVDYRRRVGGLIPRRSRIGRHRTMERTVA